MWQIFVFDQRVVLGRTLRETHAKSNVNIVKAFCDTFHRFVTQQFGELFGFYVASFSRSRNDLGQWRAYARDGQGFALGLAPQLFHVADKPDRKPHENVFFSPVIYGEQAISERMKEVIDRAIAVVTKPENASAYMGNKKIGFEFFKEVGVAISRPILWQAITSKHEAYANEKEMRLIILGGKENLRPYVETRIRASEFVPFIRSAMPVRDAGAIAEIVIGPAASEMAEDGLRIMLESMNVDHAHIVNLSKIPYRSFS
jgi:hypothetical protein